MKKTIELMPEIKLVGITCRTNNAAEFNPQTAKISQTVQKYFHQTTPILNQKNPGTTLTAYTQYESDYNGDYTFFVGAEVTSFDEVSPDFETLIIPAQHYAKFTSDPGKMPEVCINVWQQIWAMMPSDLGGERTYVTDFEVYDERSLPQNNAVLDIYVGIKKEAI